MSKLSEFRKAVNAGRKNLQKVKTVSDPTTTTFYIPDDKGVGQPVELTYCLKALSVKDTLDQYSLQITFNDDDEETEVMTSQAAMVIVGVVDPKGKRIFTAEDAEFLDSTLNTRAVLTMSMLIMANGGVGATGETEVKSD